MKWIFRKELRELAPALLLACSGLLLVGAACVLQSGGAWIYLWWCAAAGLLVGAHQAWLDHRAEGDAFLGHRALSTTSIRVARAAAGCAAVLGLVCVPWVPVVLVWTDLSESTLEGRRPLLMHGDMRFVHLLAAAGAALLAWSLVRFAGSHRRPLARPVIGVVLIVIATLAAVGRENAPTAWLYACGSAAAVLAVVFPARDVRAAGVRRLLHPAALLGLVCVAAPWLEASAWVRLVAREVLAKAYPYLVARPGGELRLGRIEGGPPHTPWVREWSVDRTELLRDERVERPWHDGGAVVSAAPTLHHAQAAWLLNAGALWLPERRWWGGQLSGQLHGWVANERLADGRFAQLMFHEARLRLVAVDSMGDVREGEVLGSIGPEGWAPGAPPPSARRFSSSAFTIPLRAPRLIPPLVVVDPDAGVVVAPEWPIDGDARAPHLAARVIPVAPGTPGPLVSAGDLWRWRGDVKPPELLTLSAPGALVALDLETEEWLSLPLEAGETLPLAHARLRREDLAYVVLRPPYRDVAAHLRVRVRPRAKDDLATTDFVLSPKDRWERVIGGVLCAVTLARPPVLNAVSLATPAPQTWDELETRWFRDGIVAGGLGTIWFVLSLVVGLLCALRARHQARCRCAHAGEIHAWTAAAFALGPIGLIWMGMLVRKSAVRATPDGRPLAVHVPADWPAPAPTGREVLC